jgi:hypothetical protein
MSRKRSNGVPPSLQFIADRKQRIAQQKQLIAELRRKGRSTVEAEAELRNELRTLAMLHNHLELIAELMTNPSGNPFGEQNAQRTVVARNRDG